MPLSFSLRAFRAFTKFWMFLLLLSVIGVWVFAFNRNTAVSSEPISLQSNMSTLPPFAPPRIAESVPEANATDVLLGIEDPLVVRFAESVKPYFIHFELEPRVELLYENNPDKTEFRLLPREPLREGSRYTLKVSYVPQETPDAPYQPLLETSFTTAMVSSVSRGVAVGGEGETIPRLREGKYIDVDLGKQEMVLFADGRAMERFIISSGKRGMDTPRGEFRIHNKAPRPWSKAYGLYMPYWMAFTEDGKFGIHELPEWPSGYKEGANHLGHPVSHGCIRLGVGSARQVYEWTDTGTTVIIH